MSQRKYWGAGGAAALGMFITLGILSSTGQFVPGNGGSVFQTITVGNFQGTVQSDTSVGTLDNFVINANTTALRWSGASAVTYDGFKCGAADCSASNEGRMLVVEATTAQSINFANEAGGSVAGNRILTLNSVTQAITASGANPNGGALFIYDGSALRWRLVAINTNIVAGAFNFSGVVTILNGGGALVVGTGGLSLSGNLAITTTGHLRALGTAPTLSACGTSPTIAGSDVAGRVVTGTTNTGCVLTFAGTNTNPASCVCSSETPDATFKCIPTATALTVTLAANSGVIFHYHCDQLI